MPELLVKLYDLPSLEAQFDDLEDKGIIIRHAIAPEKHIVVNWALRAFKEKAWVSEIEIAFSRQQPTCLLELKGETLVGFFCYEATYRGVGGPGGVIKAYRRKGIFMLLLFQAMHALKNLGYAYGIIGGASEATISAAGKAVNAQVIANSDPGPYKGML